MFVSTTKGSVRTRSALTLLSIMEAHSRMKAWQRGVGQVSSRLQMCPSTSVFYTHTHTHTGRKHTQNQFTLSIRQ